MGQDVSKSITCPPPLSLQDCFIDGQINAVRYTVYRHKIDLDYDSNLYFSQRKKRKRKRKRDMTYSSPTKHITTSCRKRSVKKHILLVRESNGSLRELKPTDTLWYMMYIQTPPYNDRLRKQFRL